MNRAITLSALLVATPASAQSLGQRLHDLPTEEWIFQGERVIDTAQTMECLHDMPGCREKNPLLGHHPSDAKLIGVSALESLAHLGVTMALNDRHPKAARTFAFVSVFAEAGVIGLNLKVRFK